MPDPQGPLPSHTAKLAGEGLSFDDVLLVPRYSDVHPTQADLRTVVARASSSTSRSRVPPWTP
jgi:IMP dehydrogenase/GMP reductase